MLQALAEKEEFATVSVIPRRALVETERMRGWLEQRIAQGTPRKPLAEIVTLTPVLASLLLERNPINRPVSAHNANALLSDIANDRFMFNGEPLIVSETGILLDGQHRCQGVKQSGKPIQTLIVFGPKEEARFTIDIGRPKSAANYLHMKGFVDTNALAAMVGNLLQFRETQNLSHGSKPTKTAIVEAAEQFKGIDESLSFVGNCRICPKSVMGFCHYVFWKRSSREAADYFIGKLVDGDGLSKRDPIWVARRRLENMPAGTRPQHRVEVIFKAWNAHRRNESPSSFQVTPLDRKLPKVER